MIIFGEWRTDELTPIYAVIIMRVTSMMPDGSNGIMAFFGPLGDFDSNGSYQVPTPGSLIYPPELRIYLPDQDDLVLPFVITIRQSASGTKPAVIGDFTVYSTSQNALGQTTITGDLTISPSTPLIQQQRITFTKVR